MLCDRLILNCLHIFLWDNFKMYPTLLESQLAQALKPKKVPKKTEAQLFEQGKPGKTKNSKRVKKGK